MAHAICFKFYKLPGYYLLPDVRFVLGFFWSGKPFPSIGISRLVSAKAGNGLAAAGEYVGLSVGVVKYLLVTGSPLGTWMTVFP